MKTELKGNKILLRKLKTSDAKDIYENVKDKEVVKWTINIPHPYKLKDAVKFIRHSNYKLKKKKGINLGIALKETNKIIGVISLNTIDWKNKKAEIGYWLGKTHWNKGIMTEAVKLVLKLSFNELKLHRIYARIFEENIGSRRVLEKNKFKQEAKLRDSLFKFGKYHNEILFGLLKKEWKQKY